MKEYISINSITTVSYTHLVLVTALLIFLYIREMNRLTGPVLALSAVLPVIILFGFIMAWRGIRKDDQLVKSLDKLR